MNFLLTLILILTIWISKLSNLAQGNEDNPYVKDACSVTRYPNVCIQSLASFSNSAKRSPSKWARAGVSVTLNEAKNVAQYLMNLRNSNMSIKGRNRVALSDCIENFQNSIDELHKSLGILRSLSRRTFDTQMSDLNTWLSASLTDDDTCLDGFEGQKGRQIELLRNRVLKANYLTSNALALANKLASTGMESVTDP